MLIWQLILVQAVTFIFIVLFLRWLLYSNIRQALKRLRKLNQDNLVKEKVLQKELERAKREAQGEVAEGRRQAEKIKQQAAKEAEKSREEMMNKVKRAAKQLVNEATKDSQRKMTGLILEMRGKAVDLAADIIKYIFTEQGRETLNNQLVDELINEIEKLEKEKIKVRDEDNEAEIICVNKLSDEQKRRLSEILSSKLDKRITLIERIDEKIVAGLIVRLGVEVIDGSIKNKLQKILPLMKEKAKEVVSHS